MTGRIVIMGSGELAPGLVATHRAGLEAAGADRVVMLDTPFGFQENAEQLTDRIGDFFRTSLGVPMEVASLRERDPSAVEQERFLDAIRSARYVFAGPGSPSYALDIWRSVGAGPALDEMVRAGGTLCFASGAALTLGRTTIPVYEIYKVGEAPVWLEGLDVMTALGFPCSVVPHWDNAEGGNHDTSRCYIGERRFRTLADQLEVGVLGVDEHTAVTIDFGLDRLTVSGRAGVTLLGEDAQVLGDGEERSLDEARHHLGSGAQVGSETASPPSPADTSFDDAVRRRDADGVLAALLDAEGTAEPARDRLRSLLVRIVDLARPGLAGRREAIGDLVDLLIDIRASARDAGAYDLSDRIRNGLDDLGVELRDTPEGTWWGLRDDHPRSWQSVRGQAER